MAIWHHYVKSWCRPSALRIIGATKPQCTKWVNDPKEKEFRIRQVNKVQLVIAKHQWSSNKIKMYWLWCANFCSLKSGGKIMFQDRPIVGNSKINSDHVISIIDVGLFGKEQWYINYDERLAHRKISILNKEKVIWLMKRCRACLVMFPILRIRLTIS